MTVDTGSDHLVLNYEAVDKALRAVIEYADYDLHKALEGDETGEDTYAEHVDRFIAAYAIAGSSPEPNPTTKTTEA